MTEVEQPPQNGIDLSAEDDDNNKARPADIEQDMREMERRKRVEAIMGSKLFREELERIVDTAREGGASGILQQLSDMVGLPTSRIGSVFKASNCLQPINDIRGIESMGYGKGEKILRCKMAATFRLLDLYGWTQGLGAQITARLKVDQEVFLVNPYGLLYHEITASSLNKVDMQGQVVEQGTTNFGVNKNHFVLHSIVHAARPDIRCAIYIGCSPVAAISSLKSGLLPLTKDSCVLGDITTHPYTGSLLDAEERDKLVRNLGPNSKVMLLSNHGALCCGETVEEAFFAACHIVQACETQLKLLPVGLDNLVLIPEESRKTIYEQARRPPEDLERKFAAALATVENNKTAAAAAADGEDVKDSATVRIGAIPKWRVGGAEFEALMRMLDNAGYRTGYIYRHPLVKSELPKAKNDVELPPAVSSLGYLLEEEELYRQGIWKKGDLRKGGDRSKWLNSPNVYQKVEVLETGTPDPKKITKWVAEGSPTHSTPVRIEDPLQFVPAGTNPKEFKRVQQQIKDNRRADKISAGPQSHILEGVTWDEANRIKDATVSSAGDHVVLMGAASKGIIQRGFQHNATVYKAPYAKNPFDNVTDDELNEYKRTVERKKKSIHGEYTDTDFSESEALSSLHASAGAQLMKHTAAAAAVSQSEPEDTSEHQVMRIQTQQAPVPSQPEVVLSDATLDFINGERSHTATNQKPPTGRDTEEIYQVEMSQKTKNQDSLNRNDDADEYDATADKENLYAGHHNIAHNKQLIAEMKNDLLFQRQKEKLVVSTLSKSNGGSFSANLSLANEQRGGLNCNKNVVNNNNNNSNNNNSNKIENLNNNIEKALTTVTENFLCPKSVECCDVVNYHPIADVEQSPIYDSAHYTDYKGAPTTLTNTTNTDSADSENQLYTKSIFCYTPHVCDTIFESLQAPKPFENDLILNVPFTRPIQAPPPTSTASTPRKRKPRLSSLTSSPLTPPRLQKRKQYTTQSQHSSPLNNRTISPYRTLSHFGFNPPQSLPEPQHKHVPRRLFTKYIPLHKTNSYEEIFSSPRYVDLCENCFEKVVRLKPELVFIKARLRNLIDVDADGGIDNGNGGGGSAVDHDDDPTPFEFIDCASSDGTAACTATTETLPAFPAHLEPVIEESSDLGSSRGSNGGGSAAAAGASVNIVRIGGDNNITNSTFIEKITRMNYSEESVNINFMNTLPAHTVTSNMSLAIETDVNNASNLNQSELEQQPVSEAIVNSNDDAIQPSTRYVTSETDIWEFGNWQMELNSLDDGENATFDDDGENATFDEDDDDDVTADAAAAANTADDTLIAAPSSNDSQQSSTSANADGAGGGRRLMSRAERNQRKHEFQELWEDHIAFFDGKHSEHTFSDTESAIDEATRQQQNEQQQQQQEIFHGRSYVSKIHFKESPLNTDDKCVEYAGIDEYKVLPERNSDEIDNADDDDDDNNSSHTYNICGSNDKLLFCSNDNSDVDMLSAVGGTFVHAIDLNVEADNENLSPPPPYIPKMQEFLLYAQNPVEADQCATTSRDLENQSDENNSNDEVAECSSSNLNGNNENDNTTRFNSLERIILEKIEVNQLKETGLIFDKIEHTIRNKLTPSKMEQLLQKQKQLEKDKFSVSPHSPELASSDNIHFAPKLTSSPEHSEGSSSFSSLNLSRIFEEDTNAKKDSGGALVKQIFSRSLDQWSYKNQQKRQNQHQQQSNLSHCIDKFQTYEDLTKAFQAEVSTPQSNMRLRRSRSLTPRNNYQSIDSATSPTPSAINITTPPPAPTKKFVYRSPSSCSMPDGQKVVVHQQNQVTTPTNCKRNFVRENIRNAAIPRNVKRLQGSNASAVFCKSPFGAVAAAATSSLSSASTSTCSLNKARKKDTNSSKLTDTDSATEISPVYAFQSKLVRGSPRFWVSMSQTTPKRLQTSSNNQRAQKRRKQQKKELHSSSSNLSRKVSNIALDDVGATATVSVQTRSSSSQEEDRTVVDEEIDALSVQIDEVHPRLERYKRKLDDFGEVVAKCARNMDECIQVQLDIEQEQKNLRENILLNQYVEQISCQVQTFSISETED